MSFSLRSGRLWGAPEEKLEPEFEPEQEDATSPNLKQEETELVRRRSARLSVGKATSSYSAPTPSIETKEEDPKNEKTELDSEDTTAVLPSPPLTRNVEIPTLSQAKGRPTESQGFELATNSASESTSNPKPSNPAPSSTPSHPLKTQDTSNLPTPHLPTPPQTPPTPLTKLSDFLFKLSPYSRLSLYASAFLKLGLETEEDLLRLRREDENLKEMLEEEGLPPFERLIFFRTLEKEREARRRKEEDDHLDSDGKGDVQVDDNEGVVREDVKGKGKEKSGSLIAD